MAEPERDRCRYASTDLLDDLTHATDPAAPDGHRPVAVEDVELAQHRRAW